MINSVSVISIKIIEIDEYRRRARRHFLSYAVKIALVLIIYLYKQGPHTVRNKADLDSGIKT